MREGKSMQDQVLDGPRLGRWNLRWPVVIVVLAFGVGLIVWGASLEDGYWSSVLANGGVAVFLALPLLLAERALAKQVKKARDESRDELGSIRVENDRAMGDLDNRLVKVQSSVASVSERLARVAERTASAVAQQRAADEATMLAPAIALAAEPSREAVINALRAADKARAIRRWDAGRGSWWGLHLAFPTHGYAATIGIVDSPDRAARLKAEFTGVGDTTFERRLEWEILREPQEFFQAVATDLRQLLGDQAPTVSPDVVLSALAGSIELALRRRIAVGQVSRWCLIGAAGSWIVSTEGLEHVEHGTLASIDALQAALTDPPVPPSAPDRSDLVDAWPQIQRWLRESDSIVPLWR